jgi:hypothetical protein
MGTSGTCTRTRCRMLADLLNVAAEAPTMGGAATCGMLQPPVRQLLTAMQTPVLTHISAELT